MKKVYLLTITLIFACCSFCKINAQSSSGSGSYINCINSSACNYNQYNGSCDFGGCTNPSACNYNPSATCDNGSCSGTSGCTTSGYCNYNPSATCDDGSCSGTPGCTNSNACNYNSGANCDDGSCSGTSGCTSPGYCNYNSGATCDDGSCSGTSGCTTSYACNYNMSATCDDGSCTYPGCTDPGANNYCSSCGCNPDNSCTYTINGCTDGDACNYNPSANNNDGSCLYINCSDYNACNYNVCGGSGCTYPGCNDPTACNYNSGAGCNDGSCTYSGCQDPAANNYCSACGCGDYSGCTYNSVGGCTNSNACNYNSSATYDDGSCSYGCGDPSACNYNSDCNSCSYPGCDDPSANNYNPSAPCFNSSLCTYNINGCTDPNACNYNSSANNNDGSCYYPGCTDFSANNYCSNCCSCSGCCTYSIDGCTDPSACNYNSSANFNDGSCQYPGCDNSNANNYDPSAPCTNNALCTYNSMSISINSESDDNCNEDIGSISAYANGGDGNFNWSISPNYGTINSSGNSVTFSGLPGGYDYQIYVTDNSGDGTANNQTVNENYGGCNIPIYISISGESDDNCNETDGSVSATASGGTGTFNWSISPGYGYISSGGNGYNYVTFSSLPGYNTYTVIVSDNNGDNTSTQSYVNEVYNNCPSDITFTTSTTNASCSNTDDGSITINPSGGDGNNNYYFTLYEECDAYSTYNGSGSSYTFSYLPACSYSITVQDYANTGDGYGTSGSASIGYNGGCNPITIYSTSYSNASSPCNDNGSLSASAYGGDGNTYNWSIYDVNNNYIGSSSSYGNYSGVTFYGLAGNTTYNLSVTDNSSDNGSDDGIYVSVTDYSCPNPISANVSETDADCSGNDGVISVSGLSGGDGDGYFYLYINQPGANGSYTAWFYGPSGWSGGGYAPGNYSIIITDGDDVYGNDGNEFSGSTTINNACALTVNLSEGDDNCNQNIGSVSVSVSNGSGNYNISCSCGQSADYVSSYTFSNLSGGNTYTITVQDNEGSSPSGSNSIYVPEDYNSCGPSGSSISASVNSSTNETCPGSDDGSMTIYATGGDGSNNFDAQVYNSNNGQWYSGSSSGSNYITIGSLPAGYYYYLNVWDNANSSDGWQISYQGIYYSIGDNNGSCGSSISASVNSSTNETCPGSDDGSITIYATGGDGTNNYYGQLYDGNNGQWYSANSNGSNYFTISGLPAGDYYYLYVYDASNNGDGWAYYNYGLYYSIGDNNGTCGSSISASVNSSTNETCPGSDDGSITVYASGGDGSTNYYAQVYDGYNGQTYTSGNSNGSNYMTISGLPAGDYYYLYVYDANNSSDGWAYYNYGLYYSIGDNNGSCGSSISISQSSTSNASCPSSSDGSVTLYVTGGDGNNYYVAEAYNYYTGQTFTSSPTSGPYVTISGMPYGYYEYYYVYDYYNSGDGWANYDYIWTYPFSYNSGTCPSPISYSIQSYTQPSCPSSYDGSITFSLSGGDGSNSYYISLYDANYGWYYATTYGTNPYTFTGLPYGDYYYILVQDADNTGDQWADNNYGAYYSLNYNNSTCPSPISYSIQSYTQPSCPSSYDGSITFSLSGGDGSNSYYISLYDANYGWYYATTYGTNPYTFTGLPYGDYYYILVQDADNTGDQWADNNYGAYYYLNYNNSTCPSPISFSVSSYTNATCPGSYDGSITLQVSGGDGTNNYTGQIYDAYSGQWYYAGPTNGSNTITFTGLYYGYYYYAYIYDAANNNDGWEDQNSSWYYYLNYNSGTCPSPISYSIQSYTQPSCPSSYDGSITFSLSGGDGSNSYYISLYDAYYGWYYATTYGTNLYTFTGLPYGDYYYILVQDADNTGDQWADNNYGAYYYLNYNSGTCPTPISFSVSTYTNATCPGSYDGSITLQVSGGDGTNNYTGQIYDAYSGQWYYAGPSNGSNTLTFTGLYYGDYYYAYIYDAANSSDGWEDQNSSWYYNLGYNLGSCPTPIYGYYSSSTNASCPTSYDGSMTFYAYNGDGTNNFQVALSWYSYEYGYQSYTSAASNGSNYITVTGIPWGYVTDVEIYDASLGSSDPYAYNFNPGSSISYNSGSCPTPIYGYETSSTNASCPTSYSGSMTFYAYNGDGTNNFQVALSWYSYEYGYQSYTSAASNGSNYITVTGIPWGYVTGVEIYDASLGSSDPYAYNFNPGTSISYNSGSCPTPIASYVSTYSNTVCPSASTGSATFYAYYGDGTNNFKADVYEYDYETGQYNWYDGTVASAGSNYVTVSGLPYGYIYNFTIYDASDSADGASYTTSTGISISYNSGSCPTPIAGYVSTYTNTVCPSASTGSATFYAYYGDGTNNFKADVYEYDYETGQYNWYDGTVASAGSNYVTVSGLPYGYIYNFTIYDASDSADGASYTTSTGISISYNSGSCPSPIYGYESSSTNTICPSTNTGTATFYAYNGDGTTNYLVDVYEYDYENGQYNWYDGTVASAGSNYVTVSGLPYGYVEEFTIYDASDSADGASYTAGTGISISYNSGSCPTPIAGYYSSSTNASCPTSYDGTMTFYAYNGDGTNNFQVEVYEYAYEYGTYQWYTASVASNGSNYVTVTGLPYGEVEEAEIYDASLGVSDPYAYTFGMGNTISYNSGSCPTPIYGYETSSTNASCPTSYDGTMTFYAYNGDGTNNFQVEVYEYAYEFGTYQWYTASVASNGSNYVTVTGLPYGEVEEAEIYDASLGTSDPYAYTFGMGNGISYNSGNCPTPIAGYYSSSTNASCPTSYDGTMTFYAYNGDGTNNFQIALSWYSYEYGNQSYTSAASNGNNYITVTGLPWGYVTDVEIYDASLGSSDPYAYNFNPGNGISYNSGNCPTPIYGYESSSTNASCPTSYDGSMTFYAQNGDGANNFQVEVYEYAYEYGTYEWYTASVASNGSNYVTVTGLPYGEVEEAEIYDASLGTSDPYAYTFGMGNTISYNSGNCPGPISAYVYTTANATCPTSSDGSIIVYASGGDGTTNYTVSAYNGYTGQWFYSNPSNGSNYIDLTVTYGEYYYVYVYDAANQSDGYADYLSPYSNVGYNQSYCPVPISFTVQSINPASNECPGTQDGSITLSVTGGDGNNNYIAYADNYYVSTENPGSSTITISGLQAGAYTPISVYDVNEYYYTNYGEFEPDADGWQDLDTNTVNVGATVNGCPIEGEVNTFTSASSPCASNGSVNMFVFYGDGSGNYIVDAYLNGSSSPVATATASGNSSGTDITIDSLAPGNYVFDVYNAASPDGADGMEGSFSFTLGTEVGLCPITGTLSATAPSTCGGSDGSISVTVTGGGDINNNYYEVDIYDSATSQLVSTQYTSSVGTVTFPLSSGSYDVSVTDYYADESFDDPYDGAALSAFEDVAAGPPLVVTITANGPTAFCQGGSVTLDAGAGYNSYLWQDNTTTTETFTASSTGTYSVTVSNANGCAGSTSQGVTVNAAPSIAPSSNSPVATGGTIDLTAAANGGGGSYTYSWTGPDSYTSGNVTSDPTDIANASTGMSGTYNVTVTDNNGCTVSGTTSVTVTGSGGSFTWTGNSGTAFGDAGNWLGGQSPSGCAANITIPSTANEPVISSNIQVGNVTVMAGVDITNNATLSVCGTWTGGNANDAVTGTGIVVLDGSSAQTISGETQFDELVINNAAGISLGAGASVSVMTSLDLENGNFDVSAGTLTFLSTSTTQCAIIDNFSNTYGYYQGTLSGTINAQRYYNSSSTFNQHFMGSPLNAPLLSQYGAGSSSGFVIPAGNCSETLIANNSPNGNVFALVESHGASCGMAQWYVEPGNVPATNGEGYSVRRSGAGTLQINGTANLNSDYELTGLTNSNWTNVTSQGHTLGSGWQLVSNPYLATIQISSVDPNVENQVQIWNTDGPYAGSYQPDLVGVDAVIPPFQAFMVKEEAATGTFTFHASDRVRTPQNFFAQNDNQLQITSENVSTGLLDKTTVAFNSNSTDSFDAQFDADKFPGDLSRHSLYSVNNTKWMAVNVLNSVSTTATVQVGFEPASSDNTANYSFTFNGINTFDPTTYIYLEDVQTGTLNDVRNGAYSFTANSTDNWSRFVLHFTPPAVISSTSAGCSSMGSISVTQPGTANWNYQLKDNNNDLISGGVLNQSNPLSLSAQAGTYTLTLIDNSGYTVTKTIIVAGAQDLTASFTMPANTVATQTEVSFSSTSQNASNFSWNFGDGTVATGVANPVHSYITPGAYTVTLTVMNATGCSASVSQSLSVTGATGIANIDAHGINMWSNANRIYIDFTQAGTVDAQIKIFNLLGQEITTDRFTSNTVYEKVIDQVDAAYVIVSVKNDDKIVTRKLFIINTQ